MTDDNRQYYYEKMKKQDSKLDKITAMIEKVMDQIKISNSSPNKMDLQKAQDPTNLVSANNKSPPLECGNSTKNGGIWTLKHEIIPPKFYELLIKIELKDDTALDLKNFYNHIYICLNAVTRLR